MSDSNRIGSHWHIACLLVAVAALTTAARAQDENVRDVTPDFAALTVFSTSEGGAFDGRDRLLVFTGRGGFRRTESAGVHWKRAMNGFLTPAGTEPFGNGFCQAPSAPSVVYSLSGLLAREPVFRSDDLGKTWHAQGVVDAEAILFDCAVDPFDASVLYASMFDLTTGTTTGLFFKSTDAGHTWSPAGSGLPPFPQFVRASPSTPGVVYVSESIDDPSIDGVYLSTDGGETFARLPASPLHAARLFLDPSGAGLFVTTWDGRLLRSTDGGATFIELPLPGEFIAISPDDPSIIYAVAANQVYRSTDFGDTFALLTGMATLPAGTAVGTVIVSPARNGRSHVFIGTSWGPFRSDDDGASFGSVVDSFGAATVNDLAIDPLGRLLVATFHTQALFRAQKAGHPRLYDVTGAALVLTQPNPAGEWDGSAVAVAPGDPDRIVLVTSNGVFWTADSGATWTRSLGVPGFGAQARVVFAPSNATRVYLTAQQRLFRSNDAGVSFQRIQGSGIGTVAVDPGNANVLYLGTVQSGVGLFKSSDGGLTIANLGAPGNFRTISIDPRNPQVVYAGAVAGGVLRSADGGVTWPSASTGLPAGETLGVSVDPIVAGRVYAWIKGGGLFASADDGATWTPANTGEALRRSGIEAGRAAMAVDHLVPGRVYLGNSGVLQIDTLPEAE